MRANRSCLLAAGALVTALLGRSGKAEWENEELQRLCTPACNKHVQSGYVGSSDLGCFVKLREKNGAGTHVLILEASREGKLLGVEGHLNVEQGKPTLPETQVRTELLSFVRRNCSPSAPR